MKGASSFPSPDGTWVLYVLSCADGTLYTGITNNLPARLDKHQNGTGAKYTKGRGPLHLAYTERLDSRSAALKRELAVKALSRADKQRLCLAGLSGADQSLPGVAPFEDTAVQ